jgi:hypothetical protein
MTPVFTKAQAENNLNRLALDCENENYHTEAGVIWNDVIPAVRALTERTTIMLVVYDGLRTMVVQP